MASSYALDLHAGQLVHVRPARGFGPPQRSKLSSSLLSGGLFQVKGASVLIAARRIVPVFECSICHREVSWEEGAADDMPDACADCWLAKEVRHG